MAKFNSLLNLTCCWRWYEYDTWKEYNWKYHIGPEEIHAKLNWINADDFGKRCLGDINPILAGRGHRMAPSQLLGFLAQRWYILLSQSCPKFGHMVPHFKIFIVLELHQLWRNDQIRPCQVRIKVLKLMCRKSQCSNIYSNDFWKVFLLLRSPHSTCTISLYFKEVSEW